MTEKQKDCIDTIKNYLSTQNDIAYKTMLNRLTKDANFEKFIQAMSIDKLVGGMSHDKNKFHWDI